MRPFLFDREMVLKDKLKASAIHLVICILIAIAIAWLVFVVWFPSPYHKISGGERIFFLILGVDLVCGPLLTFVVFDRNKKTKEIFFDMAFVALVQACALHYGIYVLSQARPVYTVFEVDRFRVVTASEIQKDKLNLAPQYLQHISWSGPRVIGVREPKNNEEYLKSLGMSLEGMPPSIRPDWWVQYTDVKENVLNSSHKMSLLYKYRSSDKKIIDDVIKHKGYSEEKLLWLPLVSEGNMGWVAFIDKNNAELVACIEIDGFIVD